MAHCNTMGIFTNSFSSNHLSYECNKFGKQTKNCNDFFKKWMTKGLLVSSVRNKFNLQRLNIKIGPFLSLMIKLKTLGSSKEVNSQPRLQYPDIEPIKIDNKIVSWTQ